MARMGLKLIRKEKHAAEYRSYVVVGWTIIEPIFKYA
jgi:hypothetical protein